jgi:predicted RNA-binding protein with PUA-like domain
MAKRYWLLKSDPDTFGWNHLMGSPKRRTVWDGIRNPQARNHLRDDVQAGDEAFFYHSGADKAVVGTCTVVRAGFPEPGKEPWVAIEIEAGKAFAEPVTLQAIKAEPDLAGMVLVKNSRLSVQPVTAKEWSVVTKMGGGARSRADR